MATQTIPGRKDSGTALRSPARDDPTRRPDAPAGSDAGAWSIEVSDSGQSSTVVEQAAILYASGEPDEALAALLDAVENDPLAVASQQVWLMLLGLLQRAGRTAEHERYALAYATRFNRSPPVSEADYVQAGEHQGSLAGKLSVASKAQIEALIPAAANHRRLALDVGRAASIDAAGCKLLIDVVGEIERNRCAVELINAANLLKLVQAAAETDGNETSQPIFQLLLQLNQRLGFVQEYEHAALEYVRRFQQSAPDWSAQAPARIDTNSSAQPDAYKLVGVWENGAEVELRSIEDYAATRNIVTLDATELERIDFITAGMLLNTVSQLASQGKTLRVAGANEMIVALFSVMGIIQHVKLLRRTA